MTCLVKALVQSWLIFLNIENFSDVIKQKSQTLVPSLYLKVSSSLKATELNKSLRYLSVSHLTKDMTHPFTAGT